MKTFLASVLFLLTLCISTHAGITDVAPDVGVVNGEMLFNDNGEIGTDSGFVYDKISNTLTVSSISATSITVSTLNYITLNPPVSGGSGDLELMQDTVQISKPTPPIDFNDHFILSIV